MHIDTHCLLDNHLYFLSHHRGILDSYPDADLIHSEKEFFNIIFLHSPENIYSLPDSYKIYIPDECVDCKKLPESYSQMGALSYMILPEHQVAWKINLDISCKKVETMEDMEEFSRVQVRGFNESDTEYNEWHPWIRGYNMKNIQDPAQSFWIAYRENQPVGVCLTVRTKNCIGIYAVATLAEERNKGISTSVMASAIQHAGRQAGEHVSLQVFSNAYAHNFYRNLGFVDAFECAIYSKEQK